MVIAVNTRLLLKDKLEGIGNYAYQILKHLVKKHPEHRFIFIFDRPYDSEFIFGDNITPVVLFPPARHPILYKIWFDYRIPGILKKYKADVFFSPDGFLSQYTQIPQIPVIHDLNFEHNPQDLRKRDATYYLKYFPKFAKLAADIITVSEFSKSDLVNTYGLEPAKISISHNAVSPDFKPISNEKQILIKDKYSFEKPYFLYVGALHKRKNIGRMLLAFDQFKKESDASHQFLIAGATMFKDPEMITIYEGLSFQKDVVFLGRVSQVILTDLMASAFALMYVSIFEGFGIPIIEAMQCGTPVLTSNTTSMPEVAGDAAVIVDPLNIDDIKEGMLSLMDEKVRTEMVIKGLEQCKKFNWEQSAEVVWEVLKRNSYFEKKDSE